MFPNSSVGYNYNGRLFGEYQCGNCRRSWMSANSWKGFAQKCEKCDLLVFAHRYARLEKPEGLNKSDPTKEHPQHLCEKCKSLGYSCNNIS